MNVPLDRLYNFLNDIIDQDIVIYRWSPHGSKLLKDLKPLLPDTTFTDTAIKPVVMCHDQEPLDSNVSSVQTLLDDRKKFYVAHYKLKELIIKSIEKFAVDEHPLKLQYLITTSYNIYNHSFVLLHSEKNSLDVRKYQSAGMHTAYYWSHAIISRDWYRYAKVDLKLSERKNIKQDFLIYKRSWTGTREYRLKFADLLIKNNLCSNCLMNFSQTDEDQHYKNYKFKNSTFIIKNYNIENYFIKSIANSSASADYNPSDYNQSLIEVVLETVFDDQRIHLTEKTLRPIACKTPFILAAGPGSLQYLRDYGFRTFGSLWDESYDNIVDSFERLCAIVDVMKEISQLSDSKKHNLYLETQKICEYNHQHYFSDIFFNCVINECKTNISTAINEMSISKEKFILNFNDTLTFLKEHNGLEFFYQNIASVQELEELYKNCGATYEFSNPNQDSI